MDHNLIQQNKTKLEAEKERLLKLLDKLGHKTSDGRYKADFPNRGDSEDDNAQEVAEYSVNIGEKKVLSERLQKVNTALDRIERGTYGTCSVGGEDIEVKRLTVAPEVDTCVAHSD